MELRRRILWIDGPAGLTVGIITLLLHAQLTQWYELPHNLLMVIGAANLIYGLYSTPLAMRAIRPKILISLLAVANMTWAAACVVLTAVYWESASFFGLGHLILEVLFVGGLGVLEWRWRDSLVNASSA